MTWSSVGRHTLNLTLFAALLSIVSCSHHNSLDSSEPFPPAEVSSFPNAVGTWWSYVICDQVTGDSSSLTISIVKDTSIIRRFYPGIDSFITETGTIWEYDYDTARYRYPVLINHDTLKIYYNMSIPLCDRYVFPIELGQSWKNAPYSFYELDSVYITARGTYRNAQNEKNSVYTLLRKIRSGGDCFNPQKSGTIVTYFMPGVGPVRTESEIFTFPPSQAAGGKRTHMIRELVDYYIEN